MVNTLYWPHTALSVYLSVLFFGTPYTRVMYGIRQCNRKKKSGRRLVHSLLKYFFKFQLWYWIKNLHYQIFKFVIDNSDISLELFAAHTEKEKFWCKRWHVTSQLFTVTCQYFKEWSRSDQLLNNEHATKIFLPHNFKYPGLNSKTSIHLTYLAKQVEG